MAESPDMDFRTEYSPTIPEDQCPSTPGPQLNIKSPELSTSSSSEEAEVAPTDGNRSPPPNCAICLGRCRNKCFTDSCMHQFCFKCLLEWSKVKPECPLCKQTFRSIIHNVKSIDQFEEYLVQPPMPASPNPYSPFNAHLFPRFPSIYNGGDLHDLAMNTLDLTGTSSSTSNANQDAHRVSVYERRLLPDPSQLLDIYSRETIHGEGSLSSGSLSQLWRRYVYDRKLYALPMPDVTGRLRDSSSRFYRENPSQVHRLMPWINRDIVCLLRNTEHNVSAVMEEINEMLMAYNILSPDFRRHLQPFLGTKTVHFIHELNNFARSPYDMIGYDRVVQYSANSTEEIVIEFSTTSSSGSDVESVNNDAQPEASAINLSTHNRGELVETTATTVEVIRAPTAERPTNIVLSSNSSDECEFVLEQKPPHLRTPELVSLNSDTDSDVVFVQETKTAPTVASGAATKWSTNSARVRRAQRRRANTNLNTNTFSTSNSDSDTFQCADASSPKKLKIDVREDNAAADATVTSATVSKPTNDQLPKVKEEFNQGASTSTGLQSRYRSTRPNLMRVRHYSHYTDTSDSDDIEESESSTSDSYLSTEVSNTTSGSDTSWSKSLRNHNKQSLNRSRHQKVNASSRKSRRQLSASAKSKRGKRTKTPKTLANKSSSSSKRKKTSKHSRRKASPKSKTQSRKKRQSVPIKDEATSDEEQKHDDEEGEQEEEEQEFVPTLASWLLLQSEGGTRQRAASMPRSSRSTSVSNSTASDASVAVADANDAAEDASSTAPLTSTTDSLTPTHPTMPPQEVSDNPNASMAIYSDTD